MTTKPIHRPIRQPQPRSVQQKGRQTIRDCEREPKGANGKQREAEGNNGKQRDATSGSGRLPKQPNWAPKVASTSTKPAKSLSIENNSWKYNGTNHECVQKLQSRGDCEEKDATSKTRAKVSGEWQCVDLSESMGQPTVKRIQK